MEVSAGVQELIGQIVATRPDAARTQRRALEKLITLDSLVAAENLALVSVLTGIETSACGTSRSCGQRSGRLECSGTNI